MDKIGQPSADLFWLKSSYAHFINGVQLHCWSPLAFPNSTANPAPKE